MNKILWILAIISMALFSFNAYPKNITTYELIIDFGEDYKFVVGIFISEKKCLLAANEIHKEEKAKAYCVKRGN